MKSGLLLILSWISLVAAVHADVLTIGPVKDNTLYQSATGSLSNGAGVNMFTGRTGQPTGVDLRRALIEFDIAGAVPAGSRIDSASLQLRLLTTNSGTTPVSLHPVLAEWGESNSVSSGGGGAGGPAAPGDATWLHTFFPGSFWTNPGGDHAATASATIDVSVPGNFFTWSSSEMQVDVQTWLDDASQNHGWVLIGNESISQSAKAFGTRELSTAIWRPALTIDFTPPPPANAYCFGVQCPCGNDDDLAGCANASTGLGARLTAGGTPSVTNDSLVLSAIRSTPNEPAMFFQGDDALNNGDGLAFGDGLRCAGHQVVRLETLSADGAGGLSSSVPIGITGGVSAGDIRRYQLWYRDPAPSPCGASFNLSNGIELSWLP